MSFSKTTAYNLALSALLLAKQVDNADSDTSNETKIFNLHWDIALATTLQDLDLDSTSQDIALELLHTLDDNGPYEFVYKYPTNCAFLRKLKTQFLTDVRSTHISKSTGIYLGDKVIFTNEFDAIAQCIPKDLPFDTIGPSALLAIAYKLAFLSAPLIVGKGAKRLRETIMVDYVLAKGEAQETDRFENFNYESDEQRSEFVEARIS